MSEFDPKKISVVSDGLANRKETSTRNNFFDISCVNYKLHIAVTSRVGIKKKSTQRYKRFRHQKGIVGGDSEPLKLAQHMITKWNNIYKIFQNYGET
ncbi:hypothetical protein MXB_560 [Myxobolus squamalis]|nr:hypothetical protein MXB_560 [Myxobolus squamalis]